MPIGSPVQQPPPAQLGDDLALAIINKGSNEFGVEHRSASSPLIR
jgi:hypothetical protein